MAKALRFLLAYLYSIVSSSKTIYPFPTSSIFVRFVVVVSPLVASGLLDEAIVLNDSCVV